MIDKSDPEFASILEFLKSERKTFIEAIIKKEEEKNKFDKLKKMNKAQSKATGNWFLQFYSNITKNNIYSIHHIHLIILSLLKLGCFPLIFLRFSLYLSYTLLSLTIYSLLFATRWFRIFFTNILFSFTIFFCSSYFFQLIIGSIF